MSTQQTTSPPPIAKQSAARYRPQMPRRLGARLLGAQRLGALLESTAARRTTTGNTTGSKAAKRTHPRSLEAGVEAAGRGERAQQHTRVIRGFYSRHERAGNCAQATAGHRAPSGAPSWRDEFANELRARSVHEELDRTTHIPNDHKRCLHQPRRLAAATAAHLCVGRLAAFPAGVAWIRDSGLRPVQLDLPNSACSTSTTCRRRCARRSCRGRS